MQVITADGGIGFTKTVHADLGSGITQLFSETLDTKTLQGKHTIKAEVTADSGSPVVENTYTFDVFTTGQLTVPKQRIAVLDPSNALKPFLKHTGIQFMEFAPGIEPILPVFVSRTEAKTAEQRKRFTALAVFIKAGGTVVYLQGGGTKAPWGVGGKASPLLPVTARLKQAIGLWNCIPHIVKDHPIFAGLPVNSMMGAIYENVWAENTLLDAGGEAMVGAIGYDWFPNYELSRRHYYGPGDTWWGADLPWFRSARVAASSPSFVLSKTSDRIQWPTSSCST